MIVAFVPAIGAPEIASVAAVVIVLAPTKAYVGAAMRIIRCAAMFPVANCTVAAPFINHALNS